jgi:hypothetical protein
MFQVPARTEADRHFGNEAGTALGSGQEGCEDRCRLRVHILPVAPLSRKVSPRLAIVLPPAPRASPSDGLGDDLVGVDKYVCT